MFHALPGLLAGAHTAPASLGTDAAVLVHLGVLAAFLGAESTSGRTGLDHPADHLLV
jgi:hypothetical protein